MDSSLASFLYCLLITILFLLNLYFWNGLYFLTLVLFNIFKKRTTDHSINWKIIFSQEENWIRNGRILSALFFLIVVLPCLRETFFPYISLVSIYSVNVNFMMMLECTAYWILVTLIVYIGTFYQSLLSFIDLILTVKKIKFWTSILSYFPKAIKWRIAFGSIKIAIHQIGKNADAWTIPFRNYILSPIVEEIVFRGTLIPLLLVGGWSPYWSSLFFSLAHGHHIFEHLLLSENSSDDLLHIYMSSLTQISYTLLFGIYTCIIYESSYQDIWPCVAVHMICNILGVPKFLSLWRDNPNGSEGSKQKKSVLLKKGMNIDHIEMDIFDAVLIIQVLFILLFIKINYGQFMSGPSSSFSKSSAAESVREKDL